MNQLLADISSRVSKRPDLEEKEVTSVFENHDFFSSLGYEGIPIDVRSEKHIVGGDRPDYFCKDRHGNTVFVVEFKKPGRSEDLAEHKSQLVHQYVEPTEADFGVLTDGQEIIMYEWDHRTGEEKLFRSSLETLSDQNITQLKRLEKPEFSPRNMRNIEARFQQMNQVSVGAEVEGQQIGQQDFLDTFRLEPGTLFYETLKNAYDLLTHYLDQNDEPFPVDAYRFWEKYYASDPGWYDLPKPWRNIAVSASNKQKLLFCVETVQSLLGRFILAKACEDNNFPGVGLSNHVQAETLEFRGEVEPVSFIQTAESLLSKLENELVESVFEQDLYFWWTEPAERADGMSPSELRDTNWSNEVKAFGESFVDLFLAISRYDFSQVRGDPLGELYQQYFDSETRRRLGEFYTPPSLVQHAVDSINIQDRGSPQLVDPACGSGTFLVESLDDYKEGLSQGDVRWSNELRKITEEGNFVGLDIHPFAVVLAQIRFMIEILPEYRKAIDENPDLVLKRLPVFRTDSLYNESVAGQEGQQTLTPAGEGLVDFNTELPVRSEGEFVKMEFSFPRFSTVREQTANEVDRQQDYFVCMQAVFDAVKEHAAENEFEVSAEVLRPYFAEYFGDTVTVDMALSPFEPTANDILSKFEELKEDYDDGRLLKLVEDLLLGALVKNYMEYDYVVGNPPWVAKQTKTRGEGDKQEMQMKQQFITAWKETDPYMQFTERALQMLREGGEMAFVIPNRVFKNEGAASLRALLAKNRIHEIIDFTDYQLFDDATNYTTFLHVEKEVRNDDWQSFINENEFTDEYEIPVTRVRDWDGSKQELMDQIGTGEGTDTIDMFDIPIERFQSRVQTRGDAVAREDISKSFDLARGEIELERQVPQVDVWPIAPPREYNILDDIEDSMQMRLGDETVVRDNQIERRGNLVGNEIREGIATSGDGAYVVNPTVSVDPAGFSSLPKITITPSSLDKEFVIETEMLKADITGSDVERWLPDWDNRLVIVPYRISSEESSIIPPQELRSEYPLTWEYFTDPNILSLLASESSERKTLHLKLCKELDIADPDQSDLSLDDYQSLSNELDENVERLSELDSDFWWYRYMYKKRLQTIPKAKVMAGDLVQYNKLCFDDSGIMAPHNASVYAILLNENNKRAVAGVLNSSLIEFYHKQNSRVHVGKAYRYIEDHTSKWPVVIPEGIRRETIETAVENIIHLRELQIKISRFPDPYIAAAREEGENFETLSYTPDSPDGEIGKQANLSEPPVVTVGDDTVEDLITSETKAEYVVQALKRAELESNEPVSIPIPRRDDVADEAVTTLKSDIETTDEGSIEQLEQQIDQEVFDAYGIAESDRELVRTYNSQYEEVGPLN